MSLPVVDWVPLLPLLAVTATAVVVLVADLFLEGSDRDALAWLSVLGLALTAIVAAVLWGHQPAKTLGGSFILDNYALFFDLLFCFASILAVLMAIDFLTTTSVRGGEYYALVLFATSGMMMMAGATDLIVIFLGLEVMSIAVYVLAGVLAPGRPLERGGAQVLSPRRVRHRVPALRHRARLRRDGEHAARRDRRTPLAPRRRGAGDVDARYRRFSSSASASRSPPFRSTCGRPTSTRVHRRRSPRSWRSA